MAKPDSIKKFDMLFLGSVAVGLLGLALGWDSVLAQMNTDMTEQGLSPDSGIATGAIIGGVVLGTGINLALWFLVSVLRIEFVKWILILFILWGLFSMAGALALVGFDLVKITGIVSTIMSIAAVWMLFKPDAKEWFAAKRGD